MKVLHFYSRIFIISICLSYGCQQTETTNHQFRSKKSDTSFHDYLFWQRVVEIHVPDSLGVLGIFQVRAANDLIYIWLNPPYLVGVFDTTGAFVKTIGSNGFGPGELRRIQTFEVDSKRNIYIVDEVTDEFYKFNVDSGWIDTKRPPKLGVMSFVMHGEMFVVFRRAYAGDHSFHIQICEVSNDSLRIIKELLPSSEESIRTRNIRSSAITANKNGVVLFSFFAGEKIYGISPQQELFDIPIDPAGYKTSTTAALVDTYKKKRAKGLMAEFFQNSRVLSIGFVNEDIFVLSFTTGRYEEAKHHIQFYSLTQKQAISSAIRVERPVYSIGNELFASWRSIDGEADNRHRLKVYKFKVE